ncbi:hypothetical protein CSKR_101997 [Clonorchis sinensis]|uniref:Uncharacterized protein n=1 Tax=Clonorchis sinensis TaxID=79923 RepID=A0A419QBJ7_CLOSI|nr:hypothetical protein CSKR_101997 [Clonorchis sinensis]
MYIHADSSGDHYCRTARIGPKYPFMRVAQSPQVVKYTHLQITLILAGNSSEFQLNLSFRMFSNRMCDIKVASGFSWHDIQDIALYFFVIAHYDKGCAANSVELYRKRDIHLSLLWTPKRSLFWRSTLICKQIWFCERLNWNPAESLVYDVSRKTKFGCK